MKATSGKAYVWLWVLVIIIVAAAIGLTIWQTSENGSSTAGVSVTNGPISDENYQAIIDRGLTANLLMGSPKEQILNMYTTQPNQYGVTQTAAIFNTGETLPQIMKYYTNYFKAIKWSFVAVPQAPAQPTSSVSITATSGAQSVSIYAAPGGPNGKSIVKVVSSAK